MPISEEARIRLLTTTKQAARAFIEDIAHIRETAQRRNIDRGELRRLSAVLRRLLVDNGGDLRSIAPPRIGGLKFLAPDNSPAYTHKIKFEVFGSGYAGGPPALGPCIRACTIRKGLHSIIPGMGREAAPIELSHDGFLNQNVLCLRGEWVSRRAVIKYMANIASGVHSDAPTEKADQLIAFIRNCVRYSTVGDNMNIEINFAAIAKNIVNENYSDPRIDPVLVEIIAACHYLILSPSIHLLEDHVRAEMALPKVEAHLSIR